MKQSILATAISVAISAATLSPAATAGSVQEHNGQSSQKISAYALLVKAEEQPRTRINPVRVHLASLTSLYAFCSPDSTPAAKRLYHKMIAGVENPPPVRQLCASWIVNVATSPMQGYGPDCNFNAACAQEMQIRAAYSLTASKLLNTAAEHLTSRTYPSETVARMAADVIAMEINGEDWLHDGLIPFLQALKGNVVLNFAQAGAPSATAGSWSFTGGPQFTTLDNGVPWLDPASGTIQGTQYDVTIGASSKQAQRHSSSSSGGGVGSSAMFQ